MADTPEDRRASAEAPDEDRQQPITSGDARGRNDGGGSAANRPPLVINSQYVKDLSFEVPAAPSIFAQMQNQQPEINVNVNVQASPLSGDAYEVVLHTQADCKIGQATAFLMELAYGGVFTINVPDEALRPVLLIECPRLLFPFARQIIANTTRDGGFMPLMLGPIDFVGMYQHQLQEQQRQKNSAAAGSDASPPAH